MNLSKIFAEQVWAVNEKCSPRVCEFYLFGFNKSGLFHFKHYLLGNILKKTHTHKADYIKIYGIEIIEITQRYTQHLGFAVELSSTVICLHAGANDHLVQKVFNHIAQHSTA